MSSILDALRRIEREAGERRSLSFGLPPEGAPARSRRPRRWAGAAAAAALLGVVAVALLSTFREGTDTGDRAAPERNTEVAMLAPEPPPPPAALGGNSPAATAGEPGADLEPGAGSERTGVEESPEAESRAQLRERVRARREAIMAELAERRGGGRTEQQQEPRRPGDQAAQGAAPPGELAAVRPWQRVLAPAAEPEVGPSAVAPAGEAPADSLARLKAGAMEVEPPPSPAARAEAEPPSAEALERQIPGEALEGVDGEATQEARAAAGRDAVPTDQASPQPTEVPDRTPEGMPADTVAEGGAPREEILRRPPRGAPRVRVSFLLYSDDPGRRRVMLSVNDGTDLVTAYEGQRIEAFEIARILPDEVHLRYEGKVFAVQPHY
jgi:hypothetical protein